MNMINVKTYDAKIICSNCKKEAIISVPKGKTVEAQLEDLKNSRLMPDCPNCECKDTYVYIII